MDIGRPFQGASSFDVYPGLKPLGYSLRPLRGHRKMSKLQGRAPSRPINQLALITRKKMGQHGGHPSLKKWLWTHVNANGTKLASAGH